MVKVLLVYAHPVLTSPWEVYRNAINAIDTDRYAIEAVINTQAGNPGLTPRPGVSLQRRGFWHGTTRRGIAGLLDRVRGFVTDARALARHVRQESIAVIHANDDVGTALFGLCVAKLSGARLVLHYHGVPKFQEALGVRPVRGRVRQHAMSFLIRRADYNIAVSRFVAGEIAALGARRGRVGFVLNGVDIRRFPADIDGSAVRQELGIGEDTILVVQMARLWRMKRQEDLVRAVAIARLRFPKLHCLMVGWEDPRYTGPFASYRDELEELCRTEGVTDAITFWQARPNVAQMHAAADVAVLASVDDPCPLVVTEAMACQRPMVAARSGGIPEILDDEVTGFLVAPCSPEAMAERIVHLAQNPELRHRMGVAAREAARDRYSIERLAEGFERVYDAAYVGALLPASVDHWVERGSAAMATRV